jgi:hypothetical protein
MVIGIFSLVGFESATALGGEAKKPLINVPRAVSWSLAVSMVVTPVISRRWDVSGHRWSGPSSGYLSARTWPASGRAIGGSPTPSTAG